MRRVRSNRLSIVLKTVERSTLHGSDPRGAGFLYGNHPHRAETEQGARGTVPLLIEETQWGLLTVTHDKHMNAGINPVDAEVNIFVFREDIPTIVA